MDEQGCRPITGHAKRIMVEVREILHHQPLLLACNGSAALLCHQIEDAFAVLAFALVRLLLVLCERCL